MPDKHLFILRHAKSSWDDPGVADHDRPLAARGRRAVDALAAHIRDARVDPALVLCSSARRTRETLEGVNPPGSWVVEPDLYDATAGSLIDRLRRISDDVPSVMVIGHNPAMQMLVLRLAAETGGVSRQRLSEVRRKFPTGALATIELDCSWSALRPGCGVLRSFVRPKQLT